MTTIIITAGIIYCLVKILSGLSARRKEAARKSEAERIRKEQAEIRAEQARQRDQIKAEIERAKLETKERIEAEKRRLEWQKRQDEINRRAERDRIRIEKEQQRQAERMEKLEAEQRKARYEIEQNRADIEAMKERTADLYARLDYFLLMQAGTIPGSAEHDKYQGKIIALRNQIHTAENKLRRAEWRKAEAERKMN